MSNQATLTKAEYQQKLEKLEKEVIKLKKESVLGFTSKIISLKGIIKGIEISEKEIAGAKKSLFKEIKI